MFISGAFAIFVSSGVSVRNALCLLSTCYLFSYVGVVVGAILGTSLNLTVWIFAVIAGMFLYIALAEMVSGTYNFLQSPLSLFLWAWTGTACPSCGDVPSPIRNLATTTATSTRTFKTNMSTLYRIVKFHLSRWKLSVIVGTFWHRNLSNMRRSGGSRPSDKGGVRSSRPRNKWGGEGGASLQNLV